MNKNLKIILELLGFIAILIFFLHSGIFLVNKVYVITGIVLFFIPCLGLKIRAKED